MIKAATDTNPAGEDVLDVVVVGGGAAGVGVAIALKHAGIENFVVLDRNTVGASFAAWPALSAHRYDCQLRRP